MALKPSPSIPIGSMAGKIYLHENQKNPAVHVGKYTGRPMDPMGIEGLCFHDIPVVT